MRALIRVVTVQVLITVGIGLAGMAQDSMVTKPVKVPEGNGVPVITDGIFSPGEWDDAYKISLRDGAELCVKQYREVVFIGVRSLNKSSVEIGPSELSLAVPGSQITKLHVSAQLGEILLAPSGPEPKYRFGLTTDWYANEFRRDDAEFQRLMKEGKTPIETIRATSYPSDGIEFAIRRSKLPGDRWFLRLWSSAFIENKPGQLTFPPSAAERTTEGWLELRLK